MAPTASGTVIPERLIPFETETRYYQSIQLCIEIPIITAMLLQTGHSGLIITFKLANCSLPLNVTFASLALLNSSSGKYMYFVGDLYRILTRIHRTLRLIAAIVHHQHIYGIVSIHVTSAEISIPCKPFGFSDHSAQLHRDGQRIATWRPGSRPRRAS